MLKVYVAGKVVLRDLPKIEGVQWLSPYAEGLTEDDVAFYAPRDLVLLRSADVVLAMFRGDERNTCTEIGIAYERRIPIIAMVYRDAEKYRFTLSLCTSVFTAWMDVEKAIKLLVA